MIVKTDEESAQEVKMPTLAEMLEAPEPEEKLEGDNEEGTEEGTTGGATKEAVVEGEAALENAEEKLEQAKEDGASKSELQELRAMVREMREANMQLRLKLGKVEAVQKGDLGAEVKPEELEVLQTTLNTLAERRSESYTTLLEAMELNPKFEDVRTVCSAGNFNDIFDTVASQRSLENGTNFDEELLKAKVEVWGMPNPYKYMYDVIKTYHPAYKGKEETAVDKKLATGSAKEVLERSAKKVINAPGTIANLAGTAVENGGWTAAKIDAMPESELRNVPRKVYEQWLSGELD